MTDNIKMERKKNGCEVWTQVKNH